MDQSVQELIDAAEDALLKAYKYYDNFQRFPELLDSLNKVKAAIKTVKENNQ